MGNLLKHQLTTPFSLSRPNVTKRDNAEGTLSDKGHNDRLQVLPPRSARASEDERTVIRRAWNLFADLALTWPRGFEGQVRGGRISSWPGEFDLHDRPDTLTQTFFLYTFPLQSDAGSYIRQVRGWTFRKPTSAQTTQLWNSHRSFPTTDFTGW